ncbi:putative colanic acid biosynthesis acetyltransferase [Novosphingobium umbonatum]|uniref:Putative colanic acid biosynthesis acetyltransferase n=2 Tax=Novosphingobium umbonatum TaxID=1908524 RepID=A0A3S2URF7_9SPHN|nr:putative colanic acid biosynthesis acetyltransferase [Novosphingobium umbonatum]
MLAGTTYGTKGRLRSFSYRHILLRLLWNTTWLLLASWTPPQMYGWRRFLLRMFGAEMGTGARVYGSARVWYPPNLTMGDHAVLGWQAYAYTMGPITIGDHAIVSQFSRLMAGTHDIHSATFQIYAKPITIEPHAWVAAGCFVGPGAHIGEGAVLGGAGVCFGRLEPWTVYAGNPARRIADRTRFIDKVTAS